ncbi:hypothetical protein CIHG_09379 [Coccidioides immitis H538.4]|uniref:Uncharacterized protein n=1 Tax=Coccidioides immitis H538.4 TaxID=396776 RepID=A0A0J8S5D1_COCIT|nr:hypothetical protein CIHG_09379 [Coccidioides immitis H538.4]
MRSPKRANRSVPDFSAVLSMARTSPRGDPIDSIAQPKGQKPNILTADAASTIADLISKIAIRRAIGVADQSYDFSPRAQPPLHARWFSIFSRRIGEVAWPDCTISERMLILVLVLVPKEEAQSARGFWSDPPNTRASTPLYQFSINATNFRFKPGKGVSRQTLIALDEGSRPLVFERNGRPPHSPPLGANSHHSSPGDTNSLSLGQRGNKAESSIFCIWKSSSDQYTMILRTALHFILEQRRIDDGHAIIQRRMTPKIIDPLPVSHRRGLIAVGVTSLLSAISTVGLFLFITYRLVFWRKQHPNYIGFNQYIILIYNLLIADFQEALGFLLSIEWIARNHISVDSPTCPAQGWLLQIGDPASGIFVTAIAVHTFLLVVMGRKMSHRTFIFFVVGLWGFCLLLVLTPTAMHGRKTFAPSGAWLSVVYFCVAGALIASSGFVDVVMYAMTRRALIVDSQPSNIDRTYASARHQQNHNHIATVTAENRASRALSRRSYQHHRRRDTERTHRRGSADNIIQEQPDLEMLGFGMGKVYQKTTIEITSEPLDAREDVSTGTASSTGPSYELVNPIDGIPVPGGGWMSPK